MTHFCSNVFRCVENLVLRFTDQSGMPLPSSPISAHSLAASQGTLKPQKVSGKNSKDAGLAIVTRVIAIDNVALRKQFRTAMDALEATAGAAGAWDDDEDLRVLRMSMPDIAQCTTRHAASRPYYAFRTHCSFLARLFARNLYGFTVLFWRRYPHARPALLFHATDDALESSICCVGFRSEFRGASSKLEGMFGNGQYFSSLPM